MSRDDEAADPRPDPAMVAALVRLQHALVAVGTPPDLPGGAGVDALRTELVDHLAGYVLPRLTAPEAPLLVVVGGPTGVGKSTLVSSIVGEQVTVPGVLRPTTRSPVIVHHPDDARWFGRDRLLPDLVRVEHPTDDPASVRLVSSTSVPAGLAILDAPDVDSVEEPNRGLAGRLLGVADLWLFVTSAARYADEVPWQHLRRAARRSTAVAVVLDRTPEEAVQTVSTHLARMLAGSGLADSPLFVVVEGKVGEDGLLPPHHVAEVRSWLESLVVGDIGTAVVRRTLEGAVRTVAGRSHEVADATASHDLRAAVREVDDLRHQASAP